MPVSVPPALPEELRPIYVDPPHPATLDEASLLRVCVMTRGRSGGPGGQHRNKVETRVDYRHTPTGLEARAGERRSPAENAKVALTRLRLELATRTRVLAPPTKPTALWASRIKGGRILLNPSHWDYPSIMAEAMDHILDERLDQRAAALRLECSPTQLVKLVATHPPALVWWNAARESRGLRALQA
jgi:hypothetical protein